MNIPKPAIEKAIKGGWSSLAMRLYERGIVLTGDGIWQQIALDPTFWQALEGPLSWKREPHWYVDEGRKTMFAIECVWHAHRFLDLILTGGDTEKFWEEILK